MDKLGVTSAAELRDRMSGYDAHVMLRDTVNGLPHVESVALVDARGDHVNSSRAWPVPHFNVADRDYFKTLTNDRNLTTMVSEPVLNRMAGTWSIFLVRKFTAPNGELIGIIIGVIGQRYVEQFFGKVNRGPGSTISLLRRDGVLLAAYPPQRAVERTSAQGNELNAVLARQQQNVARIFGADGGERLVATQDVAHPPLRISVTTTMAAALADWTREATYLAGAAGLIVLIIAGATFVLVRQFHDYSNLERDHLNVGVDRKATELVLRETERIHKMLNKQKIQLDTLMDNMLQGAVMLDADARMLVCNKRYFEMYNLSPEVAKPGCPLKELIQHCLATAPSRSDADQTVETILAAVADGKPSTTTANLAGGRIISIVTQPMAEGGWVMTHQDATEQQRMQREADRAQKFLLTVIESVPSTVIVKDARDLKYVLINQAGEKFYGLPRSKVIGRTAREIFPQSSADIITAHDISLHRQEGELSIGTQMIETPANGYRQVMVRRLAIRDSSGTPQFLLSVIDDLTKS